MFKKNYFHFCTREDNLILEGLHKNPYSVTGFPRIAVWDRITFFYSKTIITYTGTNLWKALRSPSQFLSISTRLTSKANITTLHRQWTFQQTINDSSPIVSISLLTIIKLWDWYNFVKQKLTTQASTVLCTLNLCHSDADTVRQALTTLGLSWCLPQDFNLSCTLGCIQC